MKKGSVNKFWKSSWGSTYKPLLPLNLAVAYSSPKLSICNENIVHAIKVNLQVSNILHVSRKNDFYIWATKTYLFSKVIPKTRKLEQELLMLFRKCKPVFSFLVLCDEVGVEAFKRRFGFRHFLESMVGVWIWCSISTHSLGFIKYQVKEEKLYNLGKNRPSSFRTNRRDHGEVLPRPQLTRL